jgi:hypothetical protein
MTTGLAHVLGTATVAGTQTNDEVGTVTTNELGTETMYFDGTELGTAVYETTAIDGDEARIIYSVDGNDVTNDTGTTTGLDHVDGTVTIGTETYTTAVDGTT